MHANPSFTQCFHGRRRAILAVEAAVGVVARIPRDGPAFGGDDVQRYTSLWGKGAGLLQVAPSQAGRIGQNSKHPRAITRCAVGRQKANPRRRSKPPSGPQLLKACFQGSHFGFRAGQRIVRCITAGAGLRGSELCTRRQWQIYSPHPLYSSTSFADHGGMKLGWAPPSPRPFFCGRVGFRTSLKIVFVELAFSFLPEFDVDLSGRSNL